MVNKVFHLCPTSPESKIPLGNLEIYVLEAKVDEELAETMMVAKVGGLTGQKVSRQGQPMLLDEEGCYFGVASPDR